MLLVASIALLLAVCDAMPAARLQVNGLTLQHLVARPPAGPQSTESTSLQLEEMHRRALADSTVRISQPLAGAAGRICTPTMRLKGGCGFLGVYG
jgi:hypothetical protein